VEFLERTNRPSEALKLAMLPTINMISLIIIMNKLLERGVYITIEKTFSK